VKEPKKSKQNYLQWNFEFFKDTPYYPHKKNGDTIKDFNYREQDAFITYLLLRGIIKKDKADKMRLSIIKKHNFFPVMKKYIFADDGWYETFSLLFEFIRDIKKIVKPAKMSMKKFLIKNYSELLVYLNQNKNKFKSFNNEDNKLSNAYKRLGITVGSTKDEIKKAYHNVSLFWHPDKNNDPRALEIMQDINFSYNLIMEELKKKV